MTILTYEAHAEQPEYTEANRAFLQSISLEAVQRVLDLACGTGKLSSLLFDQKANLTIVGVDSSAESLEVARAHFTARGLLVEDFETLNAAQKSDRGGILLIEHSAATQVVAPESTDLVVMGNAIHMLPDKDALLNQIYQALRSGGSFAFNTAFFAGTFPPGTEQVYTEWIKAALVVLQEKDALSRQAGQGGIPRKRGKVPPSGNKGWLSPNEWQELLEQHGFAVLHSYLRTVELTQASLAAFSQYTGFSEVMMSGYPPAISGECLAAGVYRAFEALGINAVPRFWLEITAVKQ